MNSDAVTVDVDTVKLREQEQPDGHERGADDRERLVAAEAADQLAAEDRGDEQAAHQRQSAADRSSVGLWPLTTWR